MNLSNNTQFLAQAAHFFSAIALTLLLAQVAPMWVAASAVGLGYAAKESLEAAGLTFWEPKQPWYNSLLDFAVAAAGVAVAVWL